MSLLNPDSWTLFQAISVFSLCALVIAVAGTRITRVVDQLADRTGIGEAAAGAVLLGASTSIGGSVLSVTAAWNGHAELAVSNALGGIAVQTFFLALADMAYRKANLEHAAASVPNMMQNGLLISLLGFILLAPFTPEFTVWGIHPITPLLFGFYIYGIRLVRGSQEEPMWTAVSTSDTLEDVPDDTRKMPSLPQLWMEFTLLFLVLGITGWLLEPSATTIAAEAGISHTVIGVLLTAVCTSIPELVTSIAAVRRGALTLAVGGIIGGNAFDTLFTAASDVAYRDGSIYHQMSDDALFWVSLTMVMSGVLMMGLIRRERQGLARIGLESVSILVLYAAGVAILVSGA
ncbi:cation:H+ antiporter [Pseudidiomarina planktonica]|uniref:Cation:H+ antiporter n=1 Tax=Pseudidiomarina planktonica TaxID=1323738 RepID=A0A1Y6G0V7_9GAMM|nr:cation transporter [Pseudidiomarina planktonica]RUO64029.1 cation transporter [Pseudidiomarina planktonica]SMQ79873.1 cation:H+ antiporter [Pseudidiomarina planktonica]